MVQIGETQGERWKSPHKRTEKVNHSQQRVGRVERRGQVAFAAAIDRVQIAHVERRVGVRARKLRRKEAQPRVVACARAREREKKKHRSVRLKENTIASNAC